jgi:hypothetical protein
VIILHLVVSFDIAERGGEISPAVCAVAALWLRVISAWIVVGLGESVDDTCQMSWEKRGVAPLV